ncbi:MAG: SDR family oxidoreductase [Alphaproteobacteria bacterium]
MSKKIIITGALGHIGSRLASALPDHFPGAEIVLLDDMTTQRFPSLFGLPDTATYRFVEADVTTCDLDAVVAGADAVVHLAAITDATRSFERKEETERVNFTGTERLALACAKAGVGLFYPSSTSVYGTQKDLVDEDCGPEDLNPQSPYAETKLREEELLERLGREKGLKYVTCRLGTIFGTSPGMRFHTAVNKFCWQAVMGQPVTVWTTAYEQKRPYLDLGDAVDAIAFIIKDNLFNGGIYNVLSANATVRDIVEVIRTRVPTLEVTFVEAQIMNQLSYEVLDTKFRELGFSSRAPLEDGIGATIDLLQGANPDFTAVLKPGVGS